MNPTSTRARVALAATLWCLAPAALAQAAQDPAAKLEALIARYDSAQKEFSAAMRAAQSDVEREVAQARAPKPAEYIVEAVEIAKSAPKTETAAEAWMWTAKLAPQADRADLMNQAVEALMRDHLASESVAELPGMLRGYARVLAAGESERLLREVVERAPKGAVQANGVVNLAQLLAGSEPASPERLAEAKRLYQRLASEYGELKDPRGRGFAQLAESALYELEHLQVGMSAPEIEAADLAGVNFKLSDYRGKVVLLDFWGNW